MKLMRYGARGAEKPALWDAEGRMRDLSGVLADIGPGALSPDSLRRLRRIEPHTLPLVEEPGRIGVPWAGCGKFICVGLNYSDHAAETGAQVPSEPVLFMKPTSCMVGCHDPVVLPQGSLKSDWEVELGVVIGSRARYVSEEQALEHV